MGRVSVADPSSLEGILPLFDGFPYLCVRVVGAIRHLTLLPREWPLEALDGLARRQVAANRLAGCLVLSSNLALYYGEDGGPGVVTSIPPRGGLLVTGRLQPPMPVPDTDELGQRAERLRAFVKRTQPEGCYVFGDLSKGGRPATPDERVRLEGRQAGGVPRGLARCPTCRRWTGECLDPSPEFRGQLMRVHCACDNHYRCARCGEPLAAFRLNANYYDENDDRIWHVPGFSAFSHRCPDLPSQEARDVAPRD